MKLTLYFALLHLGNTRNLNPDQSGSRPVTSMLIQTQEDDIPLKTLHSNQNSSGEIGDGVVTGVSVEFTDPDFDQNDDQDKPVEFVNQKKIDVSKIGNISFAQLIKLDGSDHE